MLIYHIQYLLENILFLILILIHIEYGLLITYIILKCGAYESFLESSLGAVQAGVGAGTGDIEGVISGATRYTGLFGYIYQTQKTLYNKSKLPPSSIGQASNGDVNNSQDVNGFSFYQYCM